ncbi:hypothetical protein PVAND_016706 [Polypedilum vanderplanki]|uniref:Sulfotransferase domain-containing protein n=1 Tax=Polypedilum vanderplanki TaxID=319348 RepID=A0A9J6BFX6_POLVA|nr:hypothetical protein PVAND_016706 [Polypedilum vanderplanki]
MRIHWKKTKNKPRPRHIKSHLPAFLLPNELWTVKPKIIYITRNPKDVAVSLYYHLKNLFGFMGEKSLIFEACLQDKMVYYPFNSHVLEFWKFKRKMKIFCFNRKI